MADTQPLKKTMKHLDDAIDTLTKKGKDIINKHGSSFMQELSTNIKKAKYLLYNNHESKPRISYNDVKQASQKQSNEAQDQYTQLFQLITNQTPATDKSNTVYDELMRKEASVLRTINRLIRDKQQEARAQTSITLTPLAQIPLNMLRALRGIMEDLMEPDTYKKYGLTVFTKNNRLAYLGLFVVIIAVFLMLIHVSTDANVSTPIPVYAPHSAN